MNAPAAEAAEPLVVQRIRFETARRTALYARMNEDPEYCILVLHQWAASTEQFANDAWWCPDEHGDMGGGMVPFMPHQGQIELFELFDWIVSTNRRRDAMILKSRQIGITAAVVCWSAHKHLFAKGFSEILASYEPDAIDKGGKFGRRPEHLFGKLRCGIDELIARCPCLIFNQGDKRGWKHTPAGYDQGEDVTNSMTRPRWLVHGSEVFSGARGNQIVGDLPDDKTGKSRTYRIAFFDEIGDYKIGADHAAWGSCSPCCRHIVGFGTIPEDAREDCLLYIHTENDPGPTMTPVKLHWSRVPWLLDGAYWTCSQCTAANDWPYASPLDRFVQQYCTSCNALNHIDQFRLRSPWFDDMCAAFNNDPVKIGRYLQMDWNASAGDVAFYTFERAKAIRERPIQVVRMWNPMDGFDPGFNKRNPACWIGAMFNRQTHVLRIVAWMMKHGVPIEWFLPFVMRWGTAKMKHVRILAGAHVGKFWNDAFHYNEVELAMIDRIACYSAGTVHGDRYGDSQHAGAEKPYNAWRRYGAGVRTKAVASKGGLIQKARDLYMPQLEIDPEVANLRFDAGDERYPSITTCLAKVKMQDSETSQGEVKKDFNKRTPRHASHPADATLAIINYLPNKIEGRATLDGHVEHRPAWDDETEDTYGESLATLGE